MPEIERLSGSTDWIDLEFVQRERTPERIIEVGIQLHLAGLSLSNTKQYLERLGVERSRTAIHNWVQKTDVQSTSDTAPDHIAIDEMVIQVNDERRWLYAAVDPETNEFLHARLFPTRTTQLTVLFLHSVRDPRRGPKPMALLLQPPVRRVRPQYTCVAMKRFKDKRVRNFATYCTSE